MSTGGRPGSWRPGPAKVALKEGSKEPQQKTRVT